MTRIRERLIEIMLLGLLASGGSQVAAQDQPGDTPDAPRAARRCAVLVIGLPGDEPHQQLFDQWSTAWQRWLIDDLGFEVDDIWRFSGHEPPGSAVQAAGENAASDDERSRAESAAVRSFPGTREALETQLGPWLAELQPRDSLWVFFLGHANYDEEHVSFHLPGPDVNEYDVARLFRDVSCREQVFWLTHACSGWFMQPLAADGRVVVTATLADREINETEFPLALTNVIQRPLEQLDADSDGRLSLTELFLAVSHEVERIFAEDQRAATEHAQLDDNGDGHGTEVADVETAIKNAADEPSPPEPNLGRVKPPDGPAAAKITLPLKPRPTKPAPETKPDEPGSPNPNPDANPDANSDADSISNPGPDVP